MTKRLLAILLLLMIATPSIASEKGLWGAILNDPTYSIHKPAQPIVVYYPEYTEKQKAASLRYWNMVDYYWNSWHRHPWHWHHW